MTQSGKGYFFQLGLVSSLTTVGALVFGIASFFTNSAFAQSVIIPDGTLGSEGSYIDKPFGDSIDVLKGGAIRGNNLYHSFLEFNVAQGKSAYFLSPSSDIQNILVRVTGSNRSEIMGFLATYQNNGSRTATSNANLFFINPNGIIIGPNAVIGPGGSFVASTASAIKFKDGNLFSATAPQTTPLLTVSVPTGLQFGRAAGEISGQGRIELLTGKTLALVGGNVQWDGKSLQPGDVSLKVPSGQIALGGILGEGEIGLNLDSDNQVLSFPNNVALADVSLRNQTEVNVNGSGGGYIQLQGQRINLTDGSKVFAETKGSQDGREVYIQAEHLTLQDGSQILVNTYNTGNGGNLVVKATGSVQITGAGINRKNQEVNPSALFTDTYGAGNAGNLTIQTGQLIVENGGNVAAATRPDSQGTGGVLTVTASSFVKLNGTSILSGLPSGLFAQTLGKGDAGSLTIDTPALTVQDGAVVRSGANKGSEGNGGNLTIHSSDFVELSGTAPNGNPSGLFAESLGSGNGGSVLLNTKNLSVREQAQVTVSASQGGNAGNLEIQAGEIRLDTKGKLLAETTSGNGGDIKLNVENLLLLRNNSQISTTAGADAAGGGNGGNININIPKGFIVTVPNENSDISANAFNGKGGNVQIEAYNVIGIEKRSREDLERLLGTSDPSKLNPQSLPSNDITAISQTNPVLNGVVRINTPDVNPSERLINLPSQPVELKVAQECKAGVAQNQNSFTVTGRGGVPAIPTETLSSDAILTNWITLDRVSKTSFSTTVSKIPIKTSPENIVEAVGWVINGKGEVVLTANAPTVRFHSFWQKSADCGALQVSS